MAEADRRVAVLTGAAGGIGRAIAGRLVRDGALVFAVDRSEAGLASLTADPSGPITAHPADLADPADRDLIIPTAVGRYGRVDLLINNAADHGGRTSFLDLDWDDWHRVLATNLTATAVLGQHAARDMATRRSGVIINLAAIQARLPLATHSAYSASKGGISALTRSMAAELAGYGIRVNAIAPGVITTPSLPSRRRSGSAALLGREGTPDEVAGVVAFLSSADASFITGAEITVDGGRTISRSADPMAEVFADSTGAEADEES